MTGLCGPPPDAETETEKLDAVLKRLIDSGAPEWRIAEASMDCLEHLLAIEHVHLAAWHACRYGSSWDDGRKLGILERMWRLGMESFAIQLCHRWGLFKSCMTKKPDLFSQMYPKLPPRTKEPRR